MLLQGYRVEGVEVTALPEAGEGLTVVHDDVGAGGVLHPTARTPAVLTLGVLGEFEHPGPERLGGVLLGQEAIGANEAVPVAGPAVVEGDLVQHPVAVEGVVHPDGGVDRVLGVAEVDAGEVGGQLAFDGEVVGVPLPVVGPPGPGAVGMVIVSRQRRRHRAAQRGGHGA